MAQEKQDKKVEEEVYPEIPAQYWFEAEKHTLDTEGAGEDAVVINCYGRMLNYGHKDYCTRKEAVALAVTILTEFAPEKLAKK